MYKAFENTTMSSGKFVSVSNGKFAIKVDSNVDGAVARTKEDGTVVHELLFSKLNCKIKSIEKIETQWGVKISFTVEGVDGEKYVLNLGYGSNYALSLLKSLTGAYNASESVSIVPYAFADDAGKKKTGITVYQNNEKLISPFTKEEIPSWKEVTINGQKGFDKTEQMEFLLNKVLEKMPTTETVSQSDTVASGVGAVDNGGSDVDDIDF